MLLHAHRFDFSPVRTIARLTVTYDGALAYGAHGWSADAPRGPLPVCHVIEDRDRGLHRGMSLAQIKALKVPGTTCIPATEAARPYPVEWTGSPKFGRFMPLIDAVPGFRGIRIHRGKDAAWSEGCPIVGLADNEAELLRTGRLDLARSVAMATWLDARIRECRERQEDVRWQITREPAAWAAFSSPVDAG
jgi:hypothetical protein